MLAPLLPRKQMLALGPSLDVSRPMRSGNGRAPAGHRLGTDATPRLTTRFFIMTIFIVAQLGHDEAHQNSHTGIGGRGRTELLPFMARPARLPGPVWAQPASGRPLAIAAIHCLRAGRTGWRSRCHAASYAATRVLRQGVSGGQTSITWGHRPDRVTRVSFPSAG